MEYATRDQAQQAIATLSNQSLMGRLVYVREVWHRILTALYRFLIKQYRTEKPNPDSLAHPPEAISAEACEVASKLEVLVPVLVALATAIRWEVVQEAVADSSTSPTLVPFRWLVLFGYVTDSMIASLQCRLARSERSLPRRR